MKHLKKLGSVLLALVMVMALAAPAFASDATGGEDGNPEATATPTPVVESVTLSTSSTGHTFTVYQIFEAAPADASSLVTDTIKWSSTVNPQTLIDALHKAYPDLGFDNLISGNVASNGTAQNVAEVLRKNFTVPGSKYNTVADNAALAEVIATSNAFSDNVAITAGTSDNNLVKTGYCVMIDKPSSGNPTYMLQVITSDTTITPKEDDTTLTKKVFKPMTNGTVNLNGVNGEWTDGAIYEDGDKVPFRLTVNLPNDIESDKYTSNTDENPRAGYNIVLHDVQSDGLTFNSDSVTVTVTAPDKSDQVLQAGRYTLTTENLTDGCTFEIAIDNVQELENALVGGKIVVDYTSTVNENAVTGEVGNSNRVDMDVNDEHIPGEEVKVFELELTVDKVDGDGNPLAGAEFTLYPTNESGDKIENEGILLTTNKDGTVFSTKKLESGTYILAETKAPSGYNKIDDIKIVIDADTTETTGSEAGTLTITINADSGFTNNGGIITSIIANLKGTQLPETGGIGTTIFYIVGGVLVVGAVVLLITKRRTSVDDE